MRSFTAPDFLFMFTVNDSYAISPLEGTIPPFLSLKDPHGCYGNEPLSNPPYSF